MVIMVAVFMMLSVSAFAYLHLESKPNVENSSRSPEVKCRYIVDPSDKASRPQAVSGFLPSSTR